VTESDAIEMLAQHTITKPVFDALFEGYSFTSVNPISIALQKVLDTLDEHDLEKESQSLQKFYASVRRRVVGINNTTAKQQILVELYDKFFRTAFPRMTQQLGIVYTPIEIVDFIIHSVNEALQSEFGQTLGSTGVHILDPFTGTGIFITRLLQSGLIKPKELAYKYGYEIHANEIMLLAYYIAAINIESVYHNIAGQYAPFDGICLTDTFDLHEHGRDLASDVLVENSHRRSLQKNLNIRVIFGNPPYSVGQKSANDNAANVAYPKLDGRIRTTYVERSAATNKNALYDSYIRAIRWASDHIGDAGIVAYISNAGWVDSNVADGLRKSLTDEFAAIYVFHLRGNARTSGEQRRKEKDNVFGQGSRTPIAITLLVKNSLSKKQGQIYFHDIGDYLSQAEKLAIISNFGSIGGITKNVGWQVIKPDEHGDWFRQRDKSFNNFIAMGAKKEGGISLFENYSRGLETSRDAWVFNFGYRAVSQNIRAMIDFYNDQLKRFNNIYLDTPWKDRAHYVDDFVNNDSNKINWTTSLKNKLVKNITIAYNQNAIAFSLYRPFTCTNVYYDENVIHRVGQIPHIFPMGNNVENRVIQINAKFNGVGMIALMSNQLSDLHCNGDSQCFPLFLYSEYIAQTDDIQSNLLNPKLVDSKLKRRNAITAAGLAHFQVVYPGKTITKNDIFYYVYAMLHSKDYQQRYKNNLSKQLPRIPVVKKFADFLAFVEAGRKLGDLHCDFNNVISYPVEFEQGDTSLIPPDNPEKFYRVEQMKFAGKRPDLDKTTVIYNENITISAIPLKAYEYIVNGKSALEWVMQQQCVKTDKASGIVNDANFYANETMGDPAYPLKLFRRVITVSLETLKIVQALPPLGESRSCHQSALYPRNLEALSIRRQRSGLGYRQ
jgi:predicted helicase